MSDLTYMTYRLPLYPGWRGWVWKVGHRWMGNRILSWFAIWHEYEMTGRFVSSAESLSGNATDDVSGFSASFRRIRP